MQGIFCCHIFKYIRNLIKYTSICREVDDDQQTVNPAAGQAQVGSQGATQNVPFGIQGQTTAAAGGQAAIPSGSSGLPSFGATASNVKPFLSQSEGYVY